MALAGLTATSAQWIWCPNLSPANCGISNVSLAVISTQPTTYVLGFKANAPGSGTSGPRSVTLGPAAAALLLLGCRRRWRTLAPPLYLLILAGASMGRVALSGCSSSSSSPSSGSGQATTYTVAVSATDRSFSLSHTATIQVTVVP